MTADIHGTREELVDFIEKQHAEIMTLRKRIQEIVRKYEDGQNHNAGAFDDGCDICLILNDLRAVLSKKDEK